VGRDGAHAEWFYGFRLAILTDLGSRIVRSWGITPAAVNEREVALGLVDGLGWLVGLLCDKGFNGAPCAAEMAQIGISVLVPPTKAQRKTMPETLQRVIAKWRNRVETCFGEITDRMELARHGAHTFWGLLTRTRRGYRRPHPPPDRITCWRTCWLSLVASWSLSQSRWKKLR